MHHLLQQWRRKTFLCSVQRNAAEECRSSVKGEHNDYTVAKIMHFLDCGSWPTKAYGDLKKKKNNLLTDPISAGVSPRSRIDVSVSHKNRLLASCICKSAYLPKSTKRGIQNPSQTEPATSQGLCDSLHEPAACLFDDFVKRADPWPFNSWWVTDATLKDGASPHMHLCQQQLTFKGCTKPLFVLYATICRRVLTDVV